MKGGVAMLPSALLRLHREGVRPPCDVLLAVLADEEAGSDYGARFLVERHVTPAARLHLEAMAAAVPEGMAAQLTDLLDPERTDEVLEALGKLKRRLGPILHNTVSVTTLRAGEKVNVIPSEVHVEVDGRLLPGFTASDLCAEIRSAAGDDFELAVTRTEPPGPLEPDMTLVSTLAAVLREMDPEAVPVPGLVTGFTDGCQFSKLGIHNYGFLPARMPAGFKAEEYVHAADERVPVEALEFGAEAMYRLLSRLGG